MRRSRSLGTRTHAIPRDARTCDGTYARVLIFQVPSRYFTDWYAKYSRLTLCTGQLAPTFVPGNDIAFLLSTTICLSFRTVRGGLSASPIFSLSLLLFSSVRQSLAVSRSLSLTLPSRSKERRRWRLITTQSPALPVRAGNSDPFSESSSNRLLPPWGIHHSAAVLPRQNQQSSSSAPRKKRPLSTVHPLLRLFSPNHRRADRSADYWHPGNPSREWRRFHFERTDRQTSNVRIKQRESEQSSEHDIARNADHWNGGGSCPDNTVITTSQDSDIHRLIFPFHFPTSDSDPVSDNTSSRFIDFRHPAAKTIVSSSFCLSRVLRKNGLFIRQLRIVELLSSFSSVTKTLPGVLNVDFR